MLPSLPKMLFLSDTGRTPLAHTYLSWNFCLTGSWHHCFSKKRETVGNRSTNASVEGEPQERQTTLLDRTTPFLDGWMSNKTVCCWAFPTTFSPNLILLLFLWTSPPLGLSRNRWQPVLQGTAPEYPLVTLWSLVQSISSRICVGQPNTLRAPRPQVRLSRTTCRRQIPLQWVSCKQTQKSLACLCVNLKTLLFTNQKKSQAKGNGGQKKPILVPLTNSVSWTSTRNLEMDLNVTIVWSSSEWPCSLLIDYSSRDGNNLGHLCVPIVHGTCTT